MTELAYPLARAGPRVRSAVRAVTRAKASLLADPDDGRHGPRLAPCAGAGDRSRRRGWLLEFELRQEESLLDWQCLAATITDLRLLGHEPTILVPPDLRSWPPRRVEERRGPPISHALERPRDDRGAPSQAVA